MAMKKGKDADPVMNAQTDGSYEQFNTPLNCQKAEEDPQTALDNSVIPWTKGGHNDDPMGILDLTGPRGRRGDPQG